MIPKRTYLFGYVVWDGVSLSNSGTDSSKLADEFVSVIFLGLFFVKLFKRT